MEDACSDSSSDNTCSASRVVINYSEREMPRFRDPGTPKLPPGGARDLTCDIERRL